MKLVQILLLSTLLSAFYTNKGFSQQTIFLVDNLGQYYRQEAGTCDAVYFGNSSNVLVTIVDIAYDYDEGQLYGISPAGHILTIDLETGFTEYLYASWIGGVSSLEYRDGKLYFDHTPSGVSESSLLYTYEISTGIIEEHGTFDHYLGDGDLAFFNDKLYLLAKGGRLIEVNTEDAALSTLVGTLPFYQNWGMIALGLDCTTETMLISHDTQQYTLWEFWLESDYCIDIVENAIFGMTVTPFKSFMEIDYSAPTCYGFSDGSITIHTEAEGPVIFTIEDASGTLLNEDNSNTANSLASGWYYYSVDDGSPCSGMDSIYLPQPAELEIDLTIYNPLCNGELTGAVKVDTVINYGGDYDQISYIWNPNPAGNNGLGADSTWALGEGDYVLTITDENGCSKSVDFEIAYSPLLEWAEFGSRPAHCRLYDYQNGNGVVFGAVIGGTPDYTYYWENAADPADNFEGTTWGGRNPGTYTLTATDSKGCTLTTSIQLDSISPIAEFSIISDELNDDLIGSAPVLAQFINESSNFSDPSDPFADTTFFWNLDTGNSEWQISHDYYEFIQTEYPSIGSSYDVEVCLVAQNKNGCTDTACKKLVIIEPMVFTPVNVFSPNGDGINDFFTFKYTSLGIHSFTCTIVNRWGETIAVLNDIEDAWNGKTANQLDCTAGTYFYVYRAVADNGLTINGQGSVQLVR